MIEWFLSLDKAAQAAIASGAVSSLIIGIVAVLGFWLTFKTSTAANREIAEITKSTKLEELHLQRKTRIAEFQEKWIADVRETISEYLSLMSDFATSTSQEDKDNKYSRINLLSFRLQLMLDMENEDNKMLIATLYDHFEDAVERKKADKDLQPIILALTRTILVRDWNKIKFEIEAHPNHTHNHN